MADNHPRVIVVGGGLAGLAASIRIGEAGVPVDLFSMVPRQERFPQRSVHRAGLMPATKSHGNKAIPNGCTWTRRSMAAIS